MTSTAPSAPVMGLKEISEYLDMKKSNVRKALERAGITPLAEPPDLAIGPVWRTEQIRAYQARREADDRLMVANARRREAALKKLEEK